MSNETLTRQVPQKRHVPRAANQPSIAGDIAGVVSCVGILLGCLALVEQAIDTPKYEHFLNCAGEDAHTPACLVRAEADSLLWIGSSRAYARDKPDLIIPDADEYYRNITIYARDGVVLWTNAKPAIAPPTTVHIGGAL